MTLSRQANRRSRSLRQQRRKGYKAAGYIRGSAPNKTEETSRSEASLQPHGTKKDRLERRPLSGSAGEGTRTHTPCGTRS